MKEKDIEREAFICNSVDCDGKLTSVFKFGDHFYVQETDYEELCLKYKWAREEIEKYVKENKNDKPETLAQTITRPINAEVSCYRKDCLYNFSVCNCQLLKPSINFYADGQGECYNYKCQNRSRGNKNGCPECGGHWEAVSYLTYPAQARCSKCGFMEYDRKIEES